MPNVRDSQRDCIIPQHAGLVGAVHHGHADQEEQRVQVAELVRQRHATGMEDWCYCSFRGLARDESFKVVQGVQAAEGSAFWVLGMFGTCVSREGRVQ